MGSRRPDGSRWGDSQRRSWWGMQAPDFIRPWVLCEAAGILFWVKQGAKAMKAFMQESDEIWFTFALQGYSEQAASLGTTHQNGFRGSWRHPALFGIYPLASLEIWSVLGEKLDFLGDKGLGTVAFCHYIVLIYHCINCIHKYLKTHIWERWRKQTPTKVIF